MQLSNQGRKRCRGPKSLVNQQHPTQQPHNNNSYNLEQDSMKGKSKVEQQCQLRCGCSFSTNDETKFRQHVLETHQGLCLSGNSHLISPFMQVVFPRSIFEDNTVINQNKQMTEAASSSEEEDDIFHDKTTLAVRNTQEASREGVSNEKSLDRSQERKQKEKKQKEKKQKEKKQKEKKHQQPWNTEQVNEPQQGQKHEPMLIWSKIKLSSNNISTKSGKFFCGCCQCSLPNMTTYVVHCIGVCQNINHPLSTYRIDTLSWEQQLNKEVIAFMLRGVKGKLCNQNNNIFRFNQCIFITNAFAFAGERKYSCGICRFTTDYCEEYIDHSQNLEQNLSPHSSHFIVREETLGRSMRKITNQEKKRISERFHIQIQQKMSFIPPFFETAFYCTKCKIQIGDFESFGVHATLHSNQINLYSSHTFKLNSNDNCFLVAFFSALLNIRHEEYQCFKCKQIFSAKQNYTKHMKMNHSNVYPKQCSHISIRLHKSPRFQLLYVPVNSIDNGKQFLCPCHTRQFTFQEFIIHILYVHKGISPILNREQFMHD